MFQVFGTGFLCGDQQQAISPPLHFIRYLQQFKNVYIKTREQDHGDGTCPVIFPLTQLYSGKASKVCSSNKNHFLPFLGVKLLIFREGQDR